MAFEDCVARAVESGDLDGEKAAEILEDYNGELRNLQSSMGFTQAQSVAAQRAVQKRAQQAMQTRRARQLSAQRAQGLIARMGNHRNIQGVLDAGQFLIDLVSNRRGAGGETLAGQYEVVRRYLRRDMTDAMVAFRATLVGTRRNGRLLEDVTREVFGESSGNAAAKALADTWKNVAEKARTRFNAAGGNIGKLDDWGLPQAHDAKAILRAAGKNAPRSQAKAKWIDDVIPMLDLAQMGAMHNSGQPFTEASIRPVLEEVFDTIVTDGRNKRSAQANYGAALWKQHAGSRFLKFRSADDWSRYSQQYGSGQDTFRIMMGHLDNMAMEISLMEVLGPNPDHTFQFLIDAAKQTEGLRDKPTKFETPTDRANRKAKRASDMLELHTGRSNVPQATGFAKGSSAIRQFLTSAHLGSAVLSSVTDFNTNRINAKFTGMNQFGPFKELMRLATSKQMRAEASEAGLILENAIDMGNAVARFEMENVHIEAAARLADGVIRSSGLGWLTEVQRQASGAHFMASNARDVGKAWGELDPARRRMFEGYGITEKGWNEIRKSPVHTDSRGLQILRANEIEGTAGQYLADRYMEAMISGTEFAVPTTDLYGKSVVLGKTKPGTIAGEAVRFGGQFKSFPITIMVMQVGRMVQEVMQGRKLNAANYFAGLVIGNTLLGALALQMKEIAKGRDPRDMTTREFWSAALLQGGGLGIFGDFFFADQNRFGGGLAETLAGPGVSFVSDTAKFTIGNVQEASRGEETGAGGELVDMLRRYTPGGSLWFGRLVYERELLDRLEELLDPSAARAFRDRQRRVEDYGTQYYAPPGASVLGGQARLPNFGNVAGD